MHGDAPETRAKRASLVLAEDHAPVAEQLRDLLGEAFDVLAVVTHGEALITATRRLRPDVVVSDVNMPRMNGLQAVRVLLSDRPELPVVFITMYDDAALARTALALGKGYVLKASAGDELVEAVTRVLHGDYFLSAALGRLEPLLERPPPLGKYSALDDA